VERHQLLVVMPGLGVAKILDALHVKVWMINSLREFEVTTVYRHPGVLLQPTFAGLEHIIDSYLEDPKSDIVSIVSIVVGDVWMFGRKDAIIIREPARFKEYLSSCRFFIRDLVESNKRSELLYFNY
jgi:hypothetical protein